MEHRFAYIHNSHQAQKKKKDFSFLTPPCISGYTFSLNGLHNCVLEFLLVLEKQNHYAENTICPSEPN